MKSFEEKRSVQAGNFDHFCLTFRQVIAQLLSTSQLQRRTEGYLALTIGSLCLQGDYPR